MKAKWPLSLVPFTLLVLGLVAWASYSPTQTMNTREAASGATDVSTSVAQVDHYFEVRWKAVGVVPADFADELQVLRRLTLSLYGTVPSLEEIREFRADGRPDRLSRWTDRILDDDRFADYFAERLARCFVGVDQGQFIIFRRDRFVDWLHAHNCEAIARTMKSCER